MLAIGRKGSNTLIDKNLTIPFRNRYGNKAVYKDKAMIAMAKALKAKENVGMLIDQKTGGSHSQRVDFFGHKARTTLSVAALKLKFDALVVPISVVRQSRGRYMLYVDAPIEYTALEIEDEKERLKVMTQRYNQALEKIVQRDITQWFWMHDRWK
jgi:KDO2-lipid IV(A) lauroyltransferase